MSHTKKMETFLNRADNNNTGTRGRDIDIIYFALLQMSHLRIPASIIAEYC